MLKTRAVAMAVTAAALIALLSLSPAVAAPGNGGASSGTDNGATISFDTTSVVVGQQYRVNGSGFKPNAWVTVGAHYADTIWWNSRVTDSEGNFSIPLLATSPGEVYHEAKERGNSGRLRVRATAMLTVSPAP